MEHLTRELEAKKAKAQGMMDKYFPGGMPTPQLIGEANQKLQERLTCEKEELLKQREEQQKLEQQVSLLDTWLQQSKQEKESLELERNQLKEANQGKLRKIIQMESVDQQNKQLKKELKEVSSYNIICNNSNPIYLIPRLSSVEDRSQITLIIHTFRSISVNSVRG